MFKKILFASVALTLSLTALAGVVQTDAATLAEGGLYKTATDSAIYLIQGSEKRVFPHAAVYKSWGYPDDYSTVETVSTAELAEFTDGTAVPFRDGSMFRGSAASIHDKDQTAVFFVSDNKVRDIKSSEIYHALFDDPNWEYVTWVPDDLLTKFEYELGTQIDSSATYPNGSLISNGGKTYLVADGELREFETGALAANRYDVSAAITPVYPVASIDDYVAGDAVGGEETVLVTPGVGPDAPDPDLPGTGLTIALASDTPISDVVIQNAARVPFTKIKLTASSDGDVEVQLTIKRTGLGQDSNLASIVFIDADTNRQIGNSKSLSSSNHSCMSNTMTVEAGETRNILIAANMGDDITSGQEVYPGELLSLDVIEVITDATVNGTLPIEGNEMTANDSIILGTVTVNRGSDDPNLGGTATTKEIGTKNLELISAKILAGSVEAFFIEGIEFENYNGTAEDTDLENLTLYVDSESYATGLLDGGIIYFDLTDNPVEIAKGKKKEFMLKGDIVDGSDRTLDFDIYDQIDIIAKGEEFKRYRLPTYTIDSTDSTAEPYFNAGNTYTIGVGTLSASASNFTPVQNIAEGTDGIALGSWTLNAKGEPIEISKLRIDFDFTTTSGGSDAYGSSTNLTNVAIFDENGDRKTSITDMTATSTFSTGGNQDGYISWTDTWTVPVGEHVYTVRGDLSSNFQNADTVVASLMFAKVSLRTVKGATTNRTTTVTPGTNIAANKQTIKAGALAIRTSTGVPASGADIVEGSATQSILAEIEYDASDSGEDVKIRQIRIINDAVGGASPQYVDNLHLYFKNVDGTTGAEIVPESIPDFDNATVNESDTVDFNLSGNPIIVPKTDLVTIQVKGTINSAEVNDGTAKHLFASATSTSAALAKGVDTGDDITETFGTTAMNQGLIVRANGTFTARFSSKTPSTNLILSNTDDLTVAVFNLEAQYEDIDLSQLTLEFVGDNASSSADDIQTIYLYDKDGLVATKAVGSGTTTTFYQLDQATNPLTVKAGRIEELTVKVKTARVGQDESGTTGNQIGYKIEIASNVAGRGHISGTSSAAIGSGSDAPTGKTMYVRQAIPEFVEANSSVLASLDALGQAGTDIAVYQFTLGPKADGGSIGLYKMVFSIVTSSASATNFYLYDATDGLTVNASSGSITIADNRSGYADSNYIMFYFDANGDISDGSAADEEYQLSATHTFQVRTSAKEDGSNLDAVKDSIAMKALSDVTIQYGPSTAQEIDTDKDNSYFVWTDRADKDGHYSSSDSTSTDEDWYNGYKIPGLTNPSTTGITLSDP